MSEDKEQALVPIEEKQIDFYGDEITAALVEVEGKSEVYVPLRALCDYLGLGWASQYQRIKRDKVLSKAIISVVITTTQIGKGHRNRDVIALRLDLLPGWLFGVSATRVKPELQEKIARYQEECFRVLWQAFQSEVFAVVEQPTTNSQTVQSLLQIREMGLSIARMAEAQLELEQRVSSTESRLNQAAQMVGRMQTDLEAVKRAVLPGAVISQAQAANVTAAVKSLAEFMTTATPGKNHYQAIFAELYRRFRVSDYNHIRQADYRAVLTFLDDWAKSAGAGAAPEQTLLELDEPGQG